MTQPGWDGDGTDPWLPTRLAHNKLIISGEKSVYDAYFAKLARWLLEVRRGVITPYRVSPENLWRYVPQWLREMTDLVHNQIAEIVGLAYRSIFGSYYRYDSRPFVVNYLAEVQNRLVRTPNEVFDVIVGQIAEGAMQGESIPALSARINLALDGANNENWANRATTVARTETIAAYNAGREGAFVQVAEDTGGEYEHMWLATADDRTRPTHRAADLQRVGLGQLFTVGAAKLARPGDPKGPAKEVINCVPADTEVSFPGLRVAMRRWYEGDMVKLRFATGDELAITPNHPVLRADGVWVPAGQLAEGDHCISRAADGGLSAAPDEEGRPAQIGEVYGAAQVAQRPERVVLAPPDLHGDGADGEIEVVAVEGRLGHDGHPATEQQVVQFGLASSHLAGLPRSGGHSGSVSLRTARGQLGSHVATPDLRAHGGGQLAPSLWAETLQTQAVGLALAAGGYPQLSESAHDEGAANSEVASDGQHAVARLVTATQVVQVERFVFVGHVYNLDTGAGWYSANSIIVRNCRCTTLLVRPGEMVDLSNRQFTDF